MALGKESKGEGELTGGGGRCSATSNHRFGRDADSEAAAPALLFAVLQAA